MVKYFVLLIGLSVLPLVGQSNARAIKFGNSLPSSCNPGDVFLKINATPPGSSIYACLSTNQWTQQGGSGGGTISGGNGSLVVGESPSNCAFTGMSSASSTGPQAICNLQFSPITSTVAVYSGIVNGIVRVPPSYFTVSGNTLTIIGVFANQLILVDYWH